jgi:uncharacterized Zn-binding protein involved in type VI secretion
MRDFVHNLKQKPEHVRKRIVLGTTSAVTGLVAIAWVGTMAATGAFSLSTGTATVATANATPQASAANTPSNFSQLAGAVAAVTGATTSAPALTIVDGESTSTFDKQQAAPSSNSATVLSF